MAEGDLGSGGGLLRANDAKLTVFALANGMDLARDRDERRLEWYNGGLERGIRVEPGPEGKLTIHVGAWPFGARERGAEAPYADDVAPEALARTLEAAIERANALKLD